MLLAFFLRLLSTFQFDFAEDEVFALEYNQVNSVSQLVKAPDFSHPPLWYLAMDPLVSLDWAPFELQLLQTLCFCICLLLSFILLENYSLKLRFLFLFILSINPFLIHYTAQFRMYSSVIGVALVTYSWFLRIVEQYATQKKAPNFKEFAVFSVLMAVGLMLDYSFFWLSLFLTLFTVFSWLKEKQKIWVTLLSTVIVSGILDLWFLPYFWKNLFTAAGANQWTPLVSFKNFLLVIGDLLGFFNNSSLVSLFVISVGVVLLLGILFYLRKNIIQLQFFALSGVIGLFVLLSYFFPHSFFYARVCVTLVIPLTFLFAYMIERCWQRKGRSLLFPLFFFTLMALSIADYFGLLAHLHFAEQPNYYWDFHKTPIHSVLDITFPEKSCLLVIPDWTYSTVLFNSTYIRNLSVLNSKKSNDVAGCLHIYYLEQMTVSNDIRFQQLQTVQNEANICKSAIVVNYAQDEKLSSCQ